MRMRAGGARSTIINTDAEVKKKAPGHLDYLGDLRRYKHFWECVKAEIGIQKAKLSNYDAFDHSEPVVTTVENMKSLRDKGLIHPQDNWKVAFDIMIGALILFSLIIVPYRIGFQIETNKTIFVTDIVIDSMFLIDVALRFNTAYIDPTTEMLVLSRQKIAEAYFQFWFWVDLASSIPFDLLATGQTPWDTLDDDSESNLNSVRLIRIVRLVRLFKIVRMLKLRRLRKHIESLNISPGFVKIMSLTFQVSFIAHLIACFWHYLTTVDVTGVLPPGIEFAETPWYELKDQATITWLTVNNLQHSTELDKYIASFYWVVTTMLSIGYGDIAATNDTERIYSIFTMLFGGVVFGALIAQVTRMIESRNPQLKAYKSKMDEIKAYLGEKKLPQHIRTQALEAYAYFLQRKSSFGETYILDGLPDEMVRKLVFELYYREISSISLFREATTYSERCFVVRLVRNIVPQRAARGEVIFNTGDIAQRILFVMSGLVRMSTLVDGDLEVIVGYVTKGGFFGDIELGKRTTRLADYKAVMNCTILAVSNDCFEEACVEFPEAGAKFKKLMEHRYKQFQAACKMPSIRSPRMEGLSKKKSGLSGKFLNSSLVRKAAELSASISLKIRGKKEDLGSIHKRRSVDFSTGKALPSRLQLWVDGDLRLPASLGDEFKIIMEQDNITYRVMYMSFEKENDVDKAAVAPRATQTRRRNVTIANKKSFERTPDTKIHRTAKVSPAPVDGPGEDYGGDSSSSSSSSDDSEIQNKRRSGSVENRDPEEASRHEVPYSQLAKQDSGVTIESASKESKKMKKAKKNMSSVPKGHIVYSEATLDFFWANNLFHPLGRGKSYWDTFIGILIVYSVIFIPIQIGFTVQYTLDSPLAWLVILDILIDFFFFCDIVVSFHTSYYSDEDDAYVLIPTVVRAKYLKTWFVVDFFSTVPFDDIVTGILQQASSLSSIRLVKVVRLTRLLKLARVMKLGKYISRLENTMGISPAVFDLTKLLSEVFFIGHVFCCVWWAISENMTSTSWIDVPENVYSLNQEPLRNAGLIPKYFTSLYVTFATLTTVGYGDITPNNTSERFMNMFIELVGATVFGYMVASVSTLIGNLDHSEQRVRERIGEVEEYLNEKNCPPVLSNAVIRHYKHKFSYISAFDETEILSRLPQRIAVRILMHNHANQIKHIPIFAHISNTSVCAYLFGLMTPSYYDADQVISQQGEQAGEIVFLIRGQAAVVREKTVYHQPQNSNENANLSAPTHSADENKKKSKIKVRKAVNATSFSNYLRMRIAKQIDKSKDESSNSSSDSNTSDTGSTDSDDSQSDYDPEPQKGVMKRRLSWSAFNSSTANHNPTLGNAQKKNDFVPKRNHWETNDNKKKNIVSVDGGTHNAAAFPKNINKTVPSAPTNTSSKEIVRLGVFNEGDFIGHSAMMEEHNTNSASVIALKPCNVYSLGKAAIHRIIREHPSIAVILQAALGKCIDKMQEELGRHHMITNRGEFLQSVKQRFKRETQFYHNVNKLVMASELDADHADSVLSKTAHLRPKSSENQFSATSRNKRVVITEKESIGKVDRILNSSTFFYDSEDEYFNADVNPVIPVGSKSLRQRMTDMLVNKKAHSRHIEVNATDDYNIIYPNKSSSVLQKALFKQAKKKGQIRRHRSFDDFLQQASTTKTNNQFTKLAKTAMINPFKIPLYMMPHKTSREMQLMSPESFEIRLLETNTKNAKLKLLRRQSFPSAGNTHWKEDCTQRGVI